MLRERVHWLFGRLSLSEIVYLNLHPELNIELIRMTTQGDKILDTPLAKVGGKGLFVKRARTWNIGGRCGHSSTFDERCTDGFSCRAASASLFVKGKIRVMRLYRILMRH